LATHIAETSQSRPGFKIADVLKKSVAISPFDLMLVQAFGDRKGPCGGAPVSGHQASLDPQGLISSPIVLQMPGLSELGAGVITCTQTRLRTMQTTKVGIREFRENLSSFLESKTPVAIPRHGATIGIYVPTKPSRAKPIWRRFGSPRA